MGASIHKGDSRQYSAVANYVSGATRNVTASATWSSGNAVVAAVSTTGNVTAPGQGTATITASYGGQSGSATVTITPPTTTPPPTTPPEIPEPGNQVNWYMVGGIIAAVVVLGGGLGFWFYRRRNVY